MGVIDAQTGQRHREPILESVKCRAADSACQQTRLHAANFAYLSYQGTILKSKCFPVSVSRTLPLLRRFKPHGCDGHGEKQVIHPKVKPRVGQHRQPTVQPRSQTKLRVKQAKVTSHTLPLFQIDASTLAVSDLSCSIFQHPLRTQHR